MTAEQQKAKELIEKVGTKEHAIVCVDEMLESFKDVNYGLNNIYQDIRTPETISQHTNNYLKFWQTVKQEIINYNTIGFGVHQSNVTNICLTEYSRPIYNICLRPLSDLTKPIKVDGYNDGKEFVPMYELCVKYACRIPENPEYGTYLLGEKNKVNYKWFFSFDNDNICFELRDNNKEFTVHSLPQYELIQQLYKWHFDIHGLIGQGLAIDINTLKNNTL